MTHFIHHSFEAMAVINMNTVCTFLNTWNIGNWSINIILIPCVNTAAGSWYFETLPLTRVRKWKGKWTLNSWPIQTSYALLLYQL